MPAIETVPGLTQGIKCVKTIKEAFLFEKMSSVKETSCNDSKIKKPFRNVSYCHPRESGNDTLKIFLKGFVIYGKVG